MQCLELLTPSSLPVIQWCTPRPRAAGAKGQKDGTESGTSTPTKNTILLKDRASTHVQHSMATNVSRQIRHYQLSLRSFIAANKEICDLIWPPSILRTIKIQTLYFHVDRSNWQDVLSIYAMICSNVPTPESDVFAFSKSPIQNGWSLLQNGHTIMYQIGPWAREMENSKPLFSLKRGVFRNQRIILSYRSKMYQLKCVGTAHTVFYMESTLPWQKERKSRCPLSSVVHPRCTCFYSHADTSTDVVPLALYVWIHVFFLTWHSFVTLFVASLCLGALDWKPTESK